MQPFSFQISECSSFGFFFQNLIGHKRCLYSEAVKIKVGGLLTYTMLTLFFVHGTSTALLVTGCQKTCLWKDGLAPRRSSVMQFSVMGYTPPECPFLVPYAVMWCRNYLFALPCDSISRCNGDRSLICRNIYGSAFKGTSNPQMQLMEHVARTDSKTMWAKMSSYKALKRVHFRCADQRLENTGCGI